VLHPVYFDAVTDGHGPTDDLESLLLRPFAFHDIRCGLCIALVAALQQTPDWVQDFAERLELPSQFFTLASRNVIPPPLDDFAVSVLGGVPEALELVFEIRE
jgi:hypothetical protein